MEGLPLRGATAAAWATVALSDVDALLSDHAYCEKKAAAAGLKLIARCPEDATLVRSMAALAKEEMRHFRQVHDLIRERGGTLGTPERDRYVRLLRQRGFQRRGGLGPVVDLLLIDGLIEARSCERMRLLAEALRRGQGPSGAGDRRRLSGLYRGLAEAEARHWELFRDLAQRFAPVARVNHRVADLAVLEAEIQRGLPHGPRMH